MNAAFLCRLDMLQELLNAGSDVNWKSKKNGSNVLHYLCKQTNKKRIKDIMFYKKILRTLLHKKVNLLERDENGDTPFHIAAM